MFCEYFPVENTDFEQIYKGLYEYGKVQDI